MFRKNFIIILYFTIALLLQFNNIVAYVSKHEVLEFFNPQDPKIINGTQANWNATAHQVSIRKRKNDGYFFGTGHICGGSLVSKDVVLSAAHCFVNYENSSSNATYLPDEQFIVVMGNLDRFELNNNTLKFDIIKIVKPTNNFNLSSFDNDIALIILNGTVPEKHASVRPIILNDGPLKNNTMCQATGWGKTENGYISDVLMTVDVPIIDFNDCRSKTEYGSAIRKGMMCAGYLKGEKDACGGDSGGPLVCHGVQAGIISWGSGCAKPLNPGVYTNMSYYKNWILKEVAYHNATFPKFAGNSVGVSPENGVSSLSCSLVLVGLTIILYVFLNRAK